MSYLLSDRSPAAEYSDRMMDDTGGLTLPAEPQAGAPGRFWEHVLGGVVLAAASFAVVLYSAYHGWVTADLSHDWAYAGVGFGFVFFAFGAFVFAFGWESGDMARSVRLAFFICLVMLATIIALLILLKSKGTAAKAAGDVGSAAASGGGDGYSPMPLVQAVGSMFLDDDDRQRKADREMAELPQTLFQIKCRGCSSSFAPVPPAAKCPYCGEEALAV
jgi:hypothetical protein